ncbi:MAG: HAD family hydrolase [Candidatus Helarchaeota archaeon]
MKTVILDIDGTLLDSQTRKEEFYKLAIDKLKENYGTNYSFTLQNFLKKRNIIFHAYPDGRRNDPKFIINAFLEDYNIPQKIFDEILVELLEFYWENLSKSRPILGASKFLYDLVQNNYNFILYSDGTTEETEFKLNLFPDGFFPTTFLAFVSDSRDCNNKKIVPLGRNKNIETFLFLKNQYDVIAVIGDSEEFDILPASQVGLYAFNVKEWSFKMIMRELLKIKL